MLRLSVQRLIALLETVKRVKRLPFYIALGFRSPSFELWIYGWGLQVGNGVRFL